MLCHAYPKHETSDPHGASNTARPVSRQLLDLKDFVAIQLISFHLLSDFAHPGFPLQIEAWMENPTHHEVSKAVLKIQMNRDKLKRPANKILHYWIGCMPVPDHRLLTGSTQYCCLEANFASGMTTGLTSSLQLGKHVGKHYKLFACSARKIRTYTPIIGLTALPVLLVIVKISGTAHRLWCLPNIETLLVCIVSFKGPDAEMIETKVVMQNLALALERSWEELSQKCISKLLKSMSRESIFIGCKGALDELGCMCFCF